MLKIYHFLQKNNQYFHTDCYILIFSIVFRQALKKARKSVSDDTIILALKEAVYNGVTNLRYIDRILSEWTKKGIKTKEDLEKEKIEFSKRKIQNNSVNNENIDYDWLNEE